MDKILLMCGGGGTEHDISVISANYIADQLSSLKDVQVFQVEIGKDRVRRTPEGAICELRKTGELIIHRAGGKEEAHYLNYAIPCLHGPPGEDGAIQAVFELMGLPYLGSGPEASMLSFNKISTKLWLQSIGVSTTPYCFLTEMDQDQLDRAAEFFESQGQHVFVKASNQGSSVGCYQVKQAKDLKVKIQEAFKYSPYVLIEKAIQGRELEVSTYIYDGELIVTEPGEIVCPGGFYSYEEKYSQASHTKTVGKVNDLSRQTVEEIKIYAKRAFKALKLRHLARIDFFLSNQGKVYLNEINTFPGHTSISMFPQMMELNGHRYGDFLTKIIKQEKRK